MKDSAPRQVISRHDYTPWPWHLDSVRLDVSVHEDETRVCAELHLERAGEGAEESGIVLNGKDLDLRSLKLDGRELAPAEYTIEGETLTIHAAPDSCALETEVVIHPERNTALEGLYASSGFLLTQCEAEGFRKITWFPDRPDVMSRYSVRIEADAGRYPVLLSNGNRVDGGETADGRHWVRFDDPFPKPSYLFALVAGDLARVQDHFTTMNGREVELNIWVEHGAEDRCEHAMTSLVNAMRWDEERFGLEYDLDVYNVVVTHAFNMGAMENKSLNIFNSRYVLARPETATDWDYQAIEGVIGHEYFHNWTGNRVTCRDWFQLTLKEGLTVFRDEEFSSDMQSRAVKRIQDVRDLRLRQYPEDAGPMAHPIRPDRYIEINNFYTATVYEKGAAVIRMVHTLLGEEGFQAGMRLYFERHDGEAVTCDDFLAAMADASGVDLGRFARWYGQSGTPVVTVTLEHDAETATARLTLRQHTPPTADQSDKVPLVIPFAVGLLDADGRALPLDDDGATTRLLVLEDEEATFDFDGIAERPVPSLLRDHSAPVRVRYDYDDGELATLVANDEDAFARWEAVQRLGLRAILARLDEERPLDEAFLGAFAGLLDDDAADPALVAEALVLPSEDLVADELDTVDPDAVHGAREFVRLELARHLGERFRARYQGTASDEPYAPTAAAMARRSLRNVCLSYLASQPDGGELATAQLAAADNMTEKLAALRALVLNHASGADEALAAFERDWRGDPLVMDKWFALQATQPGAATLDRVRDLMQHAAFDLRNPNKVRAVIGAFAMANPTGFHAADGSGYRFVADQVLALDAINPQTAARMVSAFNRWRRYDAHRQGLMRAELERIAERDGLSPDVYEIVESALGRRRRERAA